MRTWRGWGCPAHRLRLPAGSKRQRRRRQLGPNPRICLHPSMPHVAHSAPARRRPTAARRKRTHQDRRPLPTIAGAGDEGVQAAPSPRPRTAVRTCHLQQHARGQVGDRSRTIRIIARRIHVGGGALGSAALIAGAVGRSCTSPWRLSPACGSCRRTASGIAVACLAKPFVAPCNPFDAGEARNSGPMKPLLPSPRGKRRVSVLGPEPRDAVDTPKLIALACRPHMRAVIWFERHAEHLGRGRGMDVLPLADKPASRAASIGRAICGQVRSSIWE